MTDVTKSIVIPYKEVNGILVPLSLLGIKVYIPELEESPEMVSKQTESIGS